MTEETNIEVTDQNTEETENTEIEDKDVEVDETKTDDKEESKDEDGDKKDEKINPDDFEPEARNIEEKKDENKKDDEDDFDAEERRKIDQQIDKRLSPWQEKVQKQNDEIEVNNYLQDNPEFGKYKPAILKYVAHPAYKNVSINNIAAIVSAKDAQRIGAQKERTAQKKVAETKKGGEVESRKNVSTSVDYTKLTNEQMEAEIAKVKRGA